MAGYAIMGDMRDYMRGRLAAFDAAENRPDEFAARDGRPSMADRARQSAEWLRGYDSVRAAQVRADGAIERGRTIARWAESALAETLPAVDRTGALKVGRA